MARAKQGKVATLISGCLAVGIAGAIGSQYFRQKNDHIRLLSDPHKATVEVLVEGKVKSPGTYELPAGATVSQAIDAAGGPTRTADLSSIDTKQEVGPGTIVHIAPITDPNDQSRVVTQSQPKPTPRTKAKEQPTLASISLNSASAEELQAIKGIGPVLSNRIIEYRRAHGGFKSVDELNEVKGVGDKTLAKLKPFLKL